MAKLSMEKSQQHFLEERGVMLTFDFPTKISHPLSFPTLTCSGLHPLQAALHPNLSSSSFFLSLV